MHPLQQLQAHPAQILVPLALLAATVIAGFIVRSVLFRAVRAWAAGTESNLVDIVVESLPIVLWSIILGLHLATQNSEIPRIYLKYVPKTLEVLWVVSLTVALSRLAGNVVRFYGGRVIGAHSVTSITRKLAQVAVVLLGMAWLLRVFNFSLTPVLTTLGVGGLAVALGLQDTLANLFAGFYVSISGLLRIGDYIKLNSGEEGYITDINWRATTMRGTSNNLVIIPNNKLGQAIYTNYNLPDQTIGMSVSFSVGYDSDVDRVQGILLAESLAAAFGQVPGLVAQPEPYVLFSPGPGQSALVFQVNFTVNGFGAQYLAQSELRKRLYKRLKSEGVTMPFPTQTIILGEDLTDPALTDALAAFTNLPPGKALDLAAGAGRHALWLAERGWDVTAIDIVVENVPGVHYIRADLEYHEYRIAPGALGPHRVLALLAAGSAAGDRAGRAHGGTVALAGKTSGRFATSLEQLREAFPCREDHKGWKEIASGQNESRAFFIATKELVD